MREGEEVDTGLDGALYESQGHSRGRGAIVGEEKRGIVESEMMGRSRWDYENESRSTLGKTAGGTGDPSLIVGSGGTGGMGPIMGDASSDAEGAMQDEGAVELLGDNG